jgi:large subunit ribosomal protein L18
MNHKQTSHARRVRRSRCKLLEMGVPFLSVHRNAQHIYAQVLAPRGAGIIAAASSLDKTVQAQTFEKGKSKTQIAIAVGKLVAERAKAKGISKVAFDRSGFKFHGRIKALAESARDNGLQCC